MVERIGWKKKIDSLSPGKAREWQIKEYHRCAEDIEYWFRNYVYTIDARKNPAIIPFMLYDYQLDLIKQLCAFSDTFLDKSRQMGASWTIMGWELHEVLYTKGFSALNISRKESEVQDSGNTYHSLHGRLAFMYERLPPFLKPRVHTPFLNFGVPSMNSVIKGESSNSKAGRDSQYKVIFIDEAAHIECLDEMWKGCRSASNSIILCSTPPKNKVNNKFAEIKDIKNSGFKKLSFHWTQHPEYDKEWYAKKTASMTPQEIAQELEIAYDASLEARSYPEYNEQVHFLSHKVYLNPKRPLYCFQDYGLGGEVFLFAQVDVWMRMFIIYYKIYFNKLTKELIPKLYECLDHLDYHGKLEDIIFIGDKSGDKRSRTTKTSVISEYQTLSNNKINIKFKELTNDEKMKCMKECLKTYVDVNGEMKPKFNVSKEPTCIKFSECLKMLQLNKRQTDHIDNKYTHAVNAVEYGINYIFPRKKVPAAVVCVNPNQRIVEDEETKENRIVDARILKPASVSSVVSNHRISRKGVMSL